MTEKLVVYKLTKPNHGFTIFPRYDLEKVSTPNLIPPGSYAPSCALTRYPILVQCTSAFSFNQSYV